MSRTGRFIESASPSSASGRIASLNEFTSFFSSVPEDINFYEALKTAKVDAESVIDRAKAVVKRASENGSLGKLGIDEKDALVIAAYTVESSGGRLSMYDALNRTLRGAHTESTLEPIRPLLVLFLRTLRKLPMVTKTKVYRGIDVSLGHSVKTDDVTTWWAFTSVTWNMDITNTFVGSTGGSLFIIEGSCSGYDLSVLSAFPGECELLLEPETRIRTTGVVKLGSSATLIQCKPEPSVPVIEELASFSARDKMLTNRAVEKAKKSLPEEYQKAKILEMYGNHLIYIDDLFTMIGANQTPARAFLLQGQGVTDNKFFYGSAEIIGNALKTNTTLTSFILFKMEMKDEEVKRIAEGLKTNSTITKIGFPSCKLGTDGSGRILAEVLKSKTNLQYLNIAHVKDIPDGMICEILRKNTGLAHLNIEDTSFGDDGLVELSELLVKNSSLTLLNLNGNHFLGESLGRAIRTLSYALKKNSTLKSLFMKGGMIGPDRGSILVEGLKGNMSLTVVDFSNQKIGDKGAKVLGEALKANRTLKELYLEDNQITSDGFKDLAQGVKDNYSLVTLDLKLNQGGTFSSSRMKSAWGSRGGGLIM